MQKHACRRSLSSSPCEHPGPHLDGQLLGQRRQRAARQVGEQPPALPPPQRVPAALQRDLHRPVAQHQLRACRVGGGRRGGKLGAGAHAEAVCRAPCLPRQQQPQHEAALAALAQGAAEGLEKAGP
jgi:hypothetical protein